MSRDIFVISDLHLGDRGPRDNFEVGDRTRELHAFLDFVGDSGGELFILGDLFELWQVNFSRLMLARRDVLDHLAQLDVTYVPGNHDVDLAGFIDTDFLAHPFFRKLSHPFSREIGGKRFKFFHGHEVDPMNRGDDPGWGRMMSIFAGIFESENRSPFLNSGEAIESALSQVGDSMLALWSYAAAAVREELARRETGQREPQASLTPAQRPDRATEYVELVRKNRAHEGYDVAVLGHTHVPGRIGDWYFNSGTWTAAHNPFLRISPSGEVAFFHWKEGRDVAQEMPVAWSEPAPKERATPPPEKALVDEALETAKRLWHEHKQRPVRPRALRVAQGLLALGGGLTALLSLGEGLTVLLLTFGLYAFLDGALALWAARRSRWRFIRQFRYARGAMGITLGAVALLRPTFTEELLVFLVGGWALAIGAFRLIAAILFRRLGGGRWSIVVGTVTTIAGFGLMLAPARLVAPVAVAACLLLMVRGAGNLIGGLLGRQSV